MNFKLLKELGKQAETECGFDTNLFAELIIRECATVASRAENSDTDIRCTYDVITEHFGVEE